MTQRVIVLLALTSALVPALFQDQNREIEALIGRLSHDDISVREEALKRLTTLGNKAEPALRKHLTSAQGELKLRIQKLIDRIEVEAMRNIVLDPIAEVVLEGGKVQSVAYSRDGKLLASGGEHGDVILWDAVSGQRLATLYGNRWGTRSLSFSPDSRRLLAAGGNVILWDVEQRKIIQSWPNADSSKATWSPDGGKFSIVGVAVMIVDAGTLKVIRQIEDRTVSATAISHDGLRIALGTRGGQVAIHDIGTGERVSLEKAKEEAVTSCSEITFLKDGKLAYVMTDGLMRFGDKEMKTDLYLAAMSVSPAEDRIAVAGDGGEIRLYDGTGRVLGKLHRGQAFISDVAWSSDGKSLAVARDDQALHVWKDGVCTEQLGHADSPDSIAFSPDGEFLAVSGESTLIFKLKTKSAKTIPDRKSASPGRSGSEILLTGKQSIERWNAGEAKELHKLAEVTKPGDVLSLSPDGTRLVYLERELGREIFGIYLAKLTDRSRTRLLATYLMDIAWSPDGKLVAVADVYGEHGDFGDITLFDHTGAVRHRIELPEARRERMSVAFHPSGRELYWMYQAASRRTGEVPQDSSKIHILDVETLKETCVIDADASKWRFADQQLAVSHTRNELSLWHVPSRTRVKQIPFENPRRISVSTDGRMIALADESRVHVFAIRR